MITPFFDSDCGIHQMLYLLAALPDDEFFKFDVLIAVDLKINKTPRLLRLTIKDK
jgi:hypothetical protein